MYQKTVLNNGIRVITERIPEMRSIAMGVLVNASPRHESPEQSGLAHLVEHSMFEGTSSRTAQQIARLMDTAGGQMGAFTARDYTCYFATVLDDHRTYALDLLGDILLNSIFPEENLERERDAIMHEIAMSYDAPHERVSEAIREFSWPNHPLGKPIAGYRENLKNLSREEVIYFVHENYLPDRIIIAAAGQVEHLDFVAQSRDAFWRLLGESEATPELEPKYKAGVNIEHRDLSQAYFAIGIQSYPYTHEDRYGLHVMNNVLGGGISSRLFRLIREEHGLVYNIGSEYTAYQDGGMLVIEGSTIPECLMDVLKLSILELWLLAAGEKSIDEEELWKAKMQIRGQHLIGDEDTNTRMSRLATQEFYFGRHIPSDEILGQIEAVDVQALKRLAEEALIEPLSQISIAIVGPKSPEHYSVSAVEQLLASFQ